MGAGLRKIDRLEDALGLSGHFSTMTVGVCPNRLRMRWT